MEIRILDLIEGARHAKGLTVVIDVFRAFSLACYIADKGVSQYFAVSDIELAYRIKQQHADYILIGERNERIPPGFDFGNSPTHVIPIDLKGKSIVHTTSAGTQGLLIATQQADEVITGSFVNAKAIAQYITQKQPHVVSLVCMGYAAQYPTDEDTLCAQYIKSLLENQTLDINAAIETLKTTSGRRLFLPENQQHSPATDFEYCTSLNRFDFVLKALPVDLRKILPNSWPKNINEKAQEIVELKKIRVM